MLLNTYQWSTVQSHLIPWISDPQYNPTWWISDPQYNPTWFPMRSQALSGMHLQSHWAACAFTGMYPGHTNPQSKCPPQPFSPIPGCIFFVLYILPKTARLKRECSPGAGLNLSGFLLPGGQAVLCCLATSVVQTRGPAQSFSRPGSSCFLEAWERHSYCPPHRDLGMHGASIVWCELSCLVVFNSDLSSLCGSRHGLDTFWAWGFSWIDKQTTTTTGRICHRATAEVTRILQFLLYFLALV